MGKKTGTPKVPHVDPVYRPFVPGLPEAYIFDVDGTLALMGDRNPYDMRRADKDRIHLPVVQMADILATAGFPLLVVSGREDIYRKLTEDWLAFYQIRYVELHMRRYGHLGANGKKENDSVVKAEIFRDKIAPRYNIRASFDDRNRVVDMWRWLGVPCFQVAPGDF